MKELMENWSVIRIAGEQETGSHYLERLPIDGVVYEGMHDLELIGQYIVGNKSPGTNLDGVIDTATRERNHRAVFDREIDDLQ